MTQKYLRHAIKESVHYASTPTLYYDHHQAAQVNNNSQKYSSTLYLSTSDNSDLSSENNDLVLSPTDLRKAETSLKGKISNFRAQNQTEKSFNFRSQISDICL